MLFDFSLLKPLEEIFIHYSVVDITITLLINDANSPSFGGRLALFCLVSCSPALVHKSPAFYVHYKINIEYLVKNKTDLVWDLAHF